MSTNLPFKFKVGDYVYAVSSDSGIDVTDCVVQIIQIEDPQIDHIPIAAEELDGTFCGWYSPNDLRMATDAEILEAKLTL